MKLTDIIAFLAKPPKNPASPASLRAKLAAIDIDALQATVDTLEQARRKALLSTSTDEELASLEAEIARADRAVERGRAAQAELQRLLSEAEAREVQEALERKRAEAEALAQRAIAAIDETMRHAFIDIRHALRVVLEAEAAVDAVNANLPVDRHVVGPETWRNSTGGGSDTVLSRKVVTLWTYESSGERVGEREVRTIVDQGAGRGYLPTIGGPVSGTVGSARGQLVSNISVVRRKFYEVQYLPYTSLGWLGTLADAIKLPPLRGGEPAGWDSRDRNATLNDGRETLPELIARIDRESARGPADERRPQLRYELCADATESDAREAA